MQDRLPSVLVDAQYLVAGVALVLAAQQLLGWRRGRPARVALWSAISATSFTACLLVNIWVLKAPAGQMDIALILRSVLLVTTLTVQIPAVAALVDRPTPTRWVGLIAVLGCVRLGLRLATDAVYAHRVDTDGSPLYGPFIAVLSLPLLGLLLVVVVGLARRFDDRGDRTAFLAGLAATTVILVASLLATHGPASELLTGSWIVPWVAALQVIATRRTAREEQDARERTERQLAMSAELARTEQRSSLALSAGGMGWYDWDPATRALAASPEFTEMLGLEPGEVPPTIDAVLEVVHPEDRQRVAQAVAATPSSGHETEEFRVLRRDGSTIWLEAVGRAMQGPDGRVEVLGVVQDVTARKLAQDELTRVTTHDALTGLPNRAALVVGLRDAIAAGDPFALLLLDLDGFKDINDTPGHRTGDDVLVAIARRLGTVARTADLVARIGGDEFALIVAEGPETAETVADQVHAVLDPSIEVGGVAITARASVGLVHGPDGADAHTLLRRADAAMYRAKSDRGGTHRHTHDDDIGATRRLQLAGQLQRAIATGEIELHYQPTIDVRSGRCSVVEALARWRHPDHGLILPSEFVPLAEQYGLGVALARQVLTEALATCREWRDGGLAKRMAVNISPRTLRDPSFVGHVATALTQARVPGEALTVELTEDSFAEDSDELRGALGSLADLGVQLAIDDFGTGYSSLAYLERLPVHAVKLDRAFAVSLSSDGANDAIVALSIEMAHRLGLVVVAEGIETAEALAALARYGCDSAQGYLICRPAPRAEITDWLMDNMHPSLRVHALLRGHRTGDPAG